MHGISSPALISKAADIVPLFRFVRMVVSRGVWEWSGEPGMPVEGEGE